ncbi:MAG TPA: hypothetical protein VF518_08870 [Polyangia bacterium]
MANIASSRGSWWTDAHSLARRSIFMEDWVYRISGAELRVTSLDQLGTPFQSVAYDELKVTCAEAD